MFDSVVDDNVDNYVDDDVDNADDAVNLDLGAVPHDEVPDVDEVSDQLANMDLSVEHPLEQTMRTRLRFTKEQLAKMASGEWMYLPPIRCRCNRVIDQKKWNDLWRAMLEHYDYYSTHPGSFKQLMDELDLPLRECCRTTYTTPIFITESELLPGMLTDKGTELTQRLTKQLAQAKSRGDVAEANELEQRLAQERQKLPIRKSRVYHLTTMGHTYHL